MEESSLVKTDLHGWSKGCIISLQSYAPRLLMRSFAGFLREGEEEPGEFFITRKVMGAL